MAPASFLERLKNLPSSPIELDSLLQDIAPGVCGRDITLQEVVEALGSSLTHQMPSNREKGTRFMANLLHKLPATYLNSAEASFMAAFLVNRLQDHHSVQPAVFLCCLALVNQKSLGDAEVQSLLEGIFQEATVQSHVMEDRRNVFKLLKYCITNRLEAFKGLGMSLLPGLIGAIEGEGDPRNLMLVFSVVKEVASSDSIPLQPFTEELFEVAAAYFPIDFVPPHKDPYGIQAEDLVLGLRGVLAATPAFAPYCIPLLIDKLESDLTSAKLDSLHTLVACCDVYKAKDLKPHANPLWVNLRQEVMDATDKAVEEAALSAFTAVVRVLEGELTTSDPSDSLVTWALAECCLHLKTPKQQLMWPSVRLLVSLVAAGPGPATSIVRKVVPQLAEQCRGQNSSSSTPLGRQNTVSALAMIVEAASKHSQLRLENGLLTQLEGEIWEAFSSCLTTTEPQVQTATLAALPAVLPALLPLHLEQSAKTLTDLLLDPSTSTSSDSSLKDGIRTCLVRLGEHEPDIILSHTLPPLLAALQPGRMEEASARKEEEQQQLESLVSLSTSRKVLASLLPEVLKRAEVMLAEGQQDCCLLYLSAVYKMVKGREEDTESQHYLLEEWKLTQRILSLFVSLAQQQPTPSHLPCLLSLASTLRTLLAMERNPNPLIQQLVSQTVGVNSGSTDRPDASLTPLLPNTTPPMQDLLASSLDHSLTSSSNMLYMLEAVIGGAKSLPKEDSCMLVLLRKVRQFATCNSEAALREVAVLLHSTIINKLEEGVQLSQAEKEARVDTTADLDAQQASERRLAALALLAWTCKALVVRGSNLQHWWSEKLLALLGDPLLGVPAAQCFEAIVKEHSHALRPHYHARTRLLHRQRFFEGVVGPLVETFTSSQGSTKACCLVAMCSVLPHLPQPVLAPHVEKVLPVVLQGVAGGGEQVVVESVVGTLASLLRQSPAPATSHLAFLLPALIALTTNQPITVRMKALECLEALASLPATPLLPYRDDVLRGLGSVLDDHKRVVRQAATDTRMAWMLVGAPGNS